MKISSHAIKVIIKSPEDSIELQRQLIKIGFKWLYDGRYIQRLYANCIWTDKAGVIDHLLYTDMAECYEHLPCTEMTLGEVYEWAKGYKQVCDGEDGFMLDWRD